MLEVHPLARLLAVIMVIAAGFLCRRPEQLLAVYCLVLLAVAGAAILNKHIRFVAAVGLPLLIALLLMWGLIAPPPAGAGLSGVEHALAIWLRIVILGGAFQWLLLPLAEHPLHLRTFLAELRIPPSLSALLVGPIVFLPEIRRRIARIADARMAQGLPTRRLAGLQALPAMMAPLVSSLLESSLARSELWTHRALLNREMSRPPSIAYSRALTIVITCASVGSLAAAFALWI